MDWANMVRNEARALSRLPTDWVHIWICSLQQDRRTIEHLAAFLSLEERAKAASFRFRILEVRYLVRRGMLRSILASYTGTLPNEVEFVYSATGKPSLMNAVGLEFNASDAEDLFACAVSNGTQIGIDIERIRPLDDLESLARTTLTSTEFAWLMGKLPDDRVKSFLSLWTKKEAILKADGRGLRVDLRSLEIVPDGPFPAPVQLRNTDRIVSPYWVSHFKPSLDYIGAIAVKTSRLSFEFREWNPQLLQASCRSLT